MVDGIEGGGGLRGEDDAGSSGYFFGDLVGVDVIAISLGKRTRNGCELSGELFSSYILGDGRLRTFLKRDSISL